jgi:DNA-directed RNA polymerase subunit beta
MTTSPFANCFFSYGINPILEHDDANRALWVLTCNVRPFHYYIPKPIVGTGFEPSAILDSGMVVKSYWKSRVFFYSIQIKDLSKQSITYYLRKYYRSNQETCINQRPVDR